MASTVPNSEATQFRAGAEQVKIARHGGIASGEARREKATMRKTLERMLQETNNKGRTYEENIALGLIANAIDKSKGGNPEAYKTIAKMLGELESESETTETPTLTINIVDNSELEKVMYSGDDINE